MTTDKPTQARFTSGSIMRHVLIMTGTSALGLMAIFISDLANLFFLSWLGDVEIMAAIGYASSILFFTVSLAIGLSITAVALVAPAIGAGDRERARRLSVNVHFAALAFIAVFALIIWLAVPWLMDLLGAQGRTKAMAITYLRIVVPFSPALAMGICSAAVMRSLGDPRRAMQVTLTGAVVTIILDPIFIFVFGLGLEGAAIVGAITRVVFMVVGLWGVIRVHDAMTPFRLRAFIEDLPAIVKIAIPAVLTNIATPVANAYITAAISQFGDGAVAGWTVIGRLQPVAFGAVFALSGAVGPIIGQNLGAGDFGRIRQTMYDAMKFTVAYTAFAWVIMFLAADQIVASFNATGEAAELIMLFCRWLVPLFAFLGALFVANAAFNTLGRAHYSTAFNWARATLGTIPFVHAGAAVAGAQGVIAANFLGGIIFGIVAVWASFKLIDKLSSTPREQITPSSGRRAAEAIPRV